MTRESATPSSAALQTLLDSISPGAKLLGVHALEGDYSNFTHLVDASTPDGSIERIVTRRYAVFGDYDRGEKARREFKTLQLLREHGVPVPEPLYLDETGTMLGAPGIVTRYVAGRLILSEPYPAKWAEKRASALAAVHTIPLDISTTPFLLDANREALWFLGAAQTAPDYVRAHPKGMPVWQALLDYLPKFIKVTPSIVHIDYWSGNVLWENEMISAIVDWEEAAQGDPAIDVAYCRLDMALSGMADAADKFLETYEKQVKQPVANLGFWELAAIIRAMWSPSRFIYESPASEYFVKFVDATIERTRG